MTASPPFNGRIACIGEAMVELMLGSDGSPSANIAYAGDTLNSAIYLKRLLPETANVSYITVLGNDPLSRRMIDFIQAESIDTHYVTQSADRSIGLYAIETDASGERTFTYWRGQSAARTLFQADDTLDFSALAQFDVLCLSAITLAILPPQVRQALITELSRLRADKGIKVVFDSNYRPALWENTAVARETVAKAWRVTDIALPSIDDEMALFDDTDQASVLARLHSYGIERGALKRGALGPLVLGTGVEPDASQARVFDAKGITIVDTTAAGDSFNAGYLASLLSGHSDQQALQAGHECSLRVIAHAGAIIPKAHWSR